MITAAAESASAQQPAAPVATLGASNNFICAFYDCHFSRQRRRSRRAKFAE